MALVPKTSIQLISSDEIRIWDVTGDYAVGNLTGWEAPNLAKAAVTSATLEITSTAYTTPIVVDLLALAGGVPNYDTSDMFDPAGLQLTSLNLLGLTAFPDDMYTFKYNINNTYYFYNYQGFFIAAECCVRRKALNTTFPITNVEEIINGALMNYLLDALYWSACCGNTEAYTNINNYLTQLCAGCESTDMNSSINLPCGCS